MKATVRHQGDIAVIELVGCHKRACEAGVEIRLLNPIPKVRELLAVTQLSDILQISENEEKVLASFSDGSGRRVT